MRLRPVVRSLRYQHGNANGFLQSAMSLFHKSASNNQQQQQQQPPVDKTKWKFDPETGQPIQAKPTNEPADKSKNAGLDIFKGMFDNATNKGGDNAPPSFNLDPEKLQQLTQNLDFSSTVLTPELQEKLKSGDPDAMRQALNSVGQQVYSTMMQHMPKLTEAYVGSRLDHDRKGLGRSVKQTMTKQSLEKLAADNPVLKRQLEVISEQLLEQFPDASPDWLAEKSQEYFVSMARTINPDAFKDDSDPNNANRGTPKDQDVDWERWMRGEGQQAKQQQQNTQT